MSRLEIPLVGLLEESILPYEERSFEAPALDPPTLGALRSRVGSRLCAITIASAVELPSLVSSRWGTECTVIAASDTSATLRGERRVRVETARGKDSPYAAEVSTPVDGAKREDLTEIIAGAHAIIAALEAGAEPELPALDEKLRPALMEIARAVSTTDDRKEFLLSPPADALKKLGKVLAARSQGQHASCAIEAMMRQIAEKPELPKALKHRLWAQVIEIQKRLDVYDPTVSEEGDDVARLQRKLMQAGLPRAAREAAKRELRLLRSMSTNHHDYSTYLAHLDFMARLPWHPDPPRSAGADGSGTKTEKAPTADLDAVAAALDREHSGLAKAKQRVLEYLAVRALGGELSSMILCLAGPPGVGKTSIARAIAGALGRPFVRVPLGGVHDESEMRGHRTSFVAASAGRILKGLAQAGSASAVVLLDEIDKIGTDRQRSPTAALLEILDPEQNTHFQDNYLGVPYDLSHVLFIATANDVSHIHATLLDRLELVELEGYTAREKAEIARSHLLARLRAEHGLPAVPVVRDDALSLLIEGYTREAGVRQLRRELGSIFRSRALALVRSQSPQRSSEEARSIDIDGGFARTGPANPPSGEPPPITVEEVRAVLGPPRRSLKTSLDSLPVGVATGLSVSPEGGSILFIEVGLMPGKGRLRLTGRLGDVMRESAQAALAHLRIQPDRYGADASRLASDVHVHVPEAATAKDGPSAGTALFVALLSSVKGIPVRADVALTGEISLTGRVLPVGGVRPKLLAAERAGVRRVILPEENLPDVPNDLSLEIVAVRGLDDVVAAAFAGPPERRLGQEARGADSTRDKETDDAR